MALGVGLFVANREFGLAAIGLALAEGFCRVFMGVHYPTDVIGGFALGTAVTLLLAPLAMALLTPVVRAVARTERVGFLVRSGQQGEDTAGRWRSPSRDQDAMTWPPERPVHRVSPRTLTALAGS